MMVLCVLDLLFKAQAMVPTSNLIFAVIILMFSVVAPATAGPLEDAVAATHKGDYAAAHEFLRPLADDGDIRAQLRPEKPEAMPMVGVCDATTLRR